MMPDYEKMYLSLFNAVTDAITQLQQAQRTAEDRFIRTDPGSEHHEKVKKTQA